VQLGDCLTKIQETTHGGYVDMAIPSRLDTAISGCLQRYVPLNDESRVAVARTLSHAVVDMLLLFSERMATYSLRNRDQIAFDTGLLSLSLAYDGPVDRRETLLEVRLYTDASTRAGLSLDSVLRSGGEFAQLLTELMRKHPKDRRIEEMGYVLDCDDPDGVRYRRIDPPWSLEKVEDLMRRLRRK